MYKECRHVMPGGAKCKAPALNAKPYCYYHDRLHRNGSVKKTRAKDGIALEPLEDRHAIQLALSRVLCALAEGTIDPARAGKLLYGFQVATYYAAQMPIFLEENPVRSLEQSSDGQDLGPMKIRCFKDDDCKTCPFREAGECAGEDEEEEEDDAEKNDTESAKK